ncbi:hypothetical protein [Kitasatospora sp. NPDC056076]|uniref:hypothetical protein n=1 Tax=unclassified Kitasatospora TaxID=2633591 RepID=UPI0035D9B08F
MSRYTIVPADSPAGTSFPVWAVQDHRTNRLVQALPPRPEPLHFYSYDSARIWTQKNDVDWDAA